MENNGYKITLYGLLHCNDAENLSINLSVNNFDEQLIIYIENAVTLSKSLANYGVRFILLTNKINLIDEICKNKGYSLSIKEIDFTTVIPSGTRFFSAHYKLDVFKYFSTLSDEYVGLCDLDMVCINDLPTSFKNNINNKIPMHYDISEQVIPAYNHEVIIRDLERISDQRSEGRWAGGEFICGTPAFFINLNEEINNIYDNYIKMIPELHHVGDEAIVSAALERLRNRGVYIAEAGSIGIVGRYWNANVLHYQKPIDYFLKHCFLLHLPADKIFLSKIARNNTPNLKCEYLKYKRFSFFIRLFRRVVKYIYSSNAVNKFS